MQDTVEKRKETTNYTERNGRTEEVVMERSLVAGGGHASSVHQKFEVNEEAPMWKRAYNLSGGLPVLISGASAANMSWQRTGMIRRILAHGSNKSGLGILAVRYLLPGQYFKKIIASPVVETVKMNMKELKLGLWRIFYLLHPRDSVAHDHRRSPALVSLRNQMKHMYSTCR